MNLLVSCVGKYSNSGIGTGGLIQCDTECKVYNVIDYFDTTGLYGFEESVFRYIRKYNILVGYSTNGVNYIIKLTKAKDIHDIFISNNLIQVVSTGSNEVLRYNWFGQVLSKWTPGGEGDAWHLNCSYSFKGKTYLTAFGEFQNHRDWAGKAADAGFLLDMESGNKIIIGLSGPHHPRVIDNHWWICDSHKSSVNIYSLNGVFLRSVLLGGFTRGICEVSDKVYVGVSSNRQSSNRKSSLVSIDKHSFRVKQEMVLPFPEIYDIVQVPSILNKYFKNNFNIFKLDNFLPKKRKVELRKIFH